MTEIDKDGHNPTVYSSRAEMKAIEQGLPFTDPGPDDGCWNCLLYSWEKEACTKDWNNNDPDYYIPGVHDRSPTDWCEDHELDKDAEWGDYFDDSAMP